MLDKMKNTFVKMFFNPSFNSPTFMRPIVTVHTVTSARTKGRSEKQPWKAVHCREGHMEE